MSKRNGIEFLRSAFLVFFLLFCLANETGAQGQSREVATALGMLRYGRAKLCIFYYPSLPYPLAFHACLHKYSCVHMYVVMPHNSIETCFFVTCLLTSYTTST